MNRQETLAIMGVLKAAYPNFYRGMTATDANAIVDLWTSMFIDDPVETVVAAVKALIAGDSKGYPPHIGAVKDYIAKITMPQTMTEAEAWALISRAIRNSLYNSEKEFDKLHPDLQRMVGSPSQLRDWAMMDVDTLQSVVASNFQRSYRAKSQQKKEYAMLPNDVKALVGATAEKLSLGEGKIDDL